MLMPDHSFTLNDAVWIYFATILIIVLEAVTGQLKNCTKRDFGLTFLCFLTNTAITRPLVGLGIGLAGVWAFPSYAGVWSAVPVWQAALIAFVSMEFVFYWAHRWSHEGQKKGHPLNWYWKIHRTHHSATELNVTVIQRQNIFWAFFTPHIWMVALFVYVGMEAGAAVALVWLYIWNLITHTHWRSDHVFLKSRTFRALQHIIITPSMHHAHHGYGKNGKMYKNYGLFLAVFDWAFGTLYLPEDRPSRYGVPGEQPHWFEEAFYPINLLAPKKAKEPAET